MLFLLDFLLWIWEILSFCTTEVPVNVDMSRYIDANFCKTHPYFVSPYSNKEYSIYLTAYVIQIGEYMNLTEEESYIQVLVSTLQKMYVLNYTDNQLDTLDYYILNWAKLNLTSSDIADYRNMVINHPTRFIINFSAELEVKYTGDKEIFF